jgi:hypothetical protein
MSRKMTLGSVAPCMLATVLMSSLSVSAGGDTAENEGSPAALVTEENSGGIRCPPARACK